MDIIKIIGDTWSGKKLTTIRFWSDALQSDVIQQRIHFRFWQLLNLPILNLITLNINETEMSFWFGTANKFQFEWWRFLFSIAVSMKTTCAIQNIIIIIIICGCVSSLSLCVCVFVCLFIEKFNSSHLCLSLNIFTSCSVFQVHFYRSKRQHPEK